MNNRMKLLKTIGALLFSTGIFAQDINIIPAPAELKKGIGFFPITSSTVIVVKNEVDKNAATFFSNYLQQYYGYGLKTAASATANFIELTTLQTLVPGKEGAYSMNITAKGVTIQGQTASGTFYGMQTLIQLLPVNMPPVLSPNFKRTINIPQVSITDYPRFGYRGLHFDVSRHFFSVEYVKKYIDFIALHKMNYFHWHLTDDQGWRIEIKKYPKLTSVGGWRAGTIIGRYPGTGNDHTPHGGYYTQEQIKEVVQYAADRFITVIPEIEMPGHSMAALAAYPKLGTWPDSTYKVSETWGINGAFNNVLNPSEYTFGFLQDVLDEVMALFPSQYIHIGGDECDKQWWHKSAFCQQLMKEKGIKDEEGLQSYFIQRMEKYINSKGRKIIGWDEILEGGLAPNATVMSWRGEQGGIDAAKQNHNVIMTPGNPVYFDHTQTENEDSVTIGGFNPIEKVYAYEPVPAALNADQAKYVLGAQANMWTEYMGYPSKVEYMLFPRLSALSEVLWSPKATKNWDDFQKRLASQFKRYDLWKVNYSKAYFDLKSAVIPAPDNNSVLWKLESKMKTGYIGYAVSPGTSVIKYTAPVSIRKNDSYSASFYLNEKPITTLTQKFYFNKVTGKKITALTPISEKYPGDGAFTLVNGVQNEKGNARSKEFVGYEGTDCEVVIDMGKAEAIASATVHALRRESSWIYAPASMEVFVSADGKDFTSAGKAGFAETNSATGNGVLKIDFSNDYLVRYIKIAVKNYGTIPAGKSGGGHKAWLFIDEIEIN